MRLTREQGRLIRAFELPGHDRTHKAELRDHGKERIVWYVDHAIDGSDEKSWKIFVAGETAERYRK